MDSAGANWLLGFAALGAALLLLGASPVQDDSVFDSLVRQLGGLREDCTWEEFRNRSALMELIAGLDRAVPALSRTKGSQDWSVRASAAYVMGVNGLMELGEDDYLSDPHPAVRAVAALMMGPGCGGSASWNLLDRPEEKVIVERWSRPSSSSDWLPEPYSTRRFDRALDLLESPPPLDRPKGTDSPEEPPEAVEMHVQELVAGHRLRVVFEGARAAVSNELGGNRGHEAVEKILDRLVTAAHGREYERLEVLLEAAMRIPDHRDSSHIEGADCGREIGYADTLCSLIEGIWGADAERFPARAIHVLSSFAETGHERSAKLLEKFAHEYPVAWVREEAQRCLKEAKESLSRGREYAAAKRKRELETTRYVQAKREANARYRPVPSVRAPRAGGPSAPLSAGKPPPESGRSGGSTLLACAGAGILLLVACGGLAVWLRVGRLKAWRAGISVRTLQYKLKRLKLI